MLGKKTPEFPIGAEIGPCRIFKVEYVSFGDSEAFALSIKHQDSWLNEKVYNPKRSSYDTKADWENARHRAILKMEAISSLFMTTEEMVDMLHDVPDDSENRFKDYVELLVAALRSKNIGDIPVNIKTIPSRKGKPMLSSTLPFIATVESGQRLAYSHNEIDYINSLNQ